MGFFNSGGNKQGTFIEGRESKPHTHSSGKSGTDTYAAKVSYDNGKAVSEKNAGFGHVSNNSDGTKTGHLK